MDEHLAQSLIDGLIAQSLAGAGENQLLAGLCARLIDSGIPLLRVSVATQLLHPTAGGRGVIWWRGHAAMVESFPRTNTPEGEAMRRTSPFDHLIMKHLPRQRWRLDECHREGQFPLLDQLKAKGATEYVALIVEVGAQASLSAARDVALSWATDRPTGFSDAELALIERLAPALTFTMNAARNVATGLLLLETYLGTDAAARVLSGNVVRGQAETIRAAVWFSDLADFTRIADTTPPDAMLAMLNDYAGCLTDAVHAHDGQVLKFVGDGLLAIFRDDDQPRACARALDAASHAKSAMRTLNEQRHAAGFARTDFTLALHFGELLYGNFGSRTRLDFTVLGPAVNETSRIADMCRSLDQRVLVSSAFVNAAGNRRATLVSLGRYALRGVGRPQELFTLDAMAA